MPGTLHLTNAYHDASGGIRVFYQALLAGAARHRRAVRLIVPAARTWIEDLNPWARVYHVAAPASRVIDSRYRLLLPHRYLVGRFGPIWRILREEQPDLIEICDKYALVYLGGLIRRRWFDGQQRPALTALTCERMDDNVATFLTRGRVGQDLSRWYMRHVYTPQFDAHLAVSGYAASEIPSEMRPVTVAPMGIETAVFTSRTTGPAERAAIFGDRALDSRVVILLCVGRLSPEKQLARLLDAVAILSRHGDRAYHLYLAGDGPMRPWLEHRAASVAPGRVHLLGHVADQERLARVYANADLLVHPNDREPYGLAPLEAMASGLAVVVPAAGGVLEYASDDNAWLVTPGAWGLAEGVLHAMRNPSERRRRIARARETARRLDWSSVIATYFAFYDRVIAQSTAYRPFTSSRWRSAAQTL